MAIDDLGSNDEHPIVGELIKKLRKLPLRNRLIYLLCNHQFDDFPDRDLNLPPEDLGIDYTRRSVGSNLLDVLEVNNFPTKRKSLPNLDEYDSKLDSSGQYQLYFGNNE